MVISIINKNLKIPLYLQLMQEIIKKIDNGFYKENDKLPSERELCSMYNLSRITVRQALQELEREGYINKVHGVGTFIAPKRYDQPLVKLYSFTEEMKKIGKNPSTKVIEFTTLTIDEHLAKKMNLLPNEEVYKIIRLRLADNEPLIYETTYLPKQKFPNLSANDLVTRPMYTVFYEDYRIEVTRAVETFSATVVREDESKYLEVNANQPAMLITRHAYFKDQLIEFTVSVARGEKFKYIVELS